jgi:hypothetical protein
MLSYNFDGILAHPSIFECLLQQFLLLFLDFLPIEQWLPFFHVFLVKNDVLQILIWALMRVSDGLLDEGQHYLIWYWEVGDDLDEFLKTVEDLVFSKDGILASEGSQESLGDVKGALIVRTVLLLNWLPFLNIG